MALENGIERALMVHPSGVYGQFIRGGGNIDTKVAQGWLFLASDRNRLAREVDLYELREGKPVKVIAVEEMQRIQHAVMDRINDILAKTPKRGPGRPRKTERP